MLQFKGRGGGGGGLAFIYFYLAFLVLKRVKAAGAQ